MQPLPPSPTIPIKTALAALGMRQWQLALRVGCAQSTFSEYVRGARGWPEGMAARVEKCLGLKKGLLSAPSPARKPRRQAGVR